MTVTACPTCRDAADLDDAAGAQVCRRCATVLDASRPDPAVSLERALVGIDRGAWMIRRARGRPAAADSPYRVGDATTTDRHLWLAWRAPRPVRTTALVAAAVALLAALALEWTWLGPVAAVALVAALTAVVLHDADHTRIEVGPGTLTIRKPWRTLRLAVGAARRLRVRVVRVVRPGRRPRYRLEVIHGGRRRGRGLVELDQAWVAVSLAREIDATLGLPSGLLDTGPTT